MSQAVWFAHVCLHLAISTFGHALSNLVEAAESLCHHGYGRFRIPKVFEGIVCPRIVFGGKTGPSNENERRAVPPRPLAGARGVAFAVNLSTR